MRHDPVIFPFLPKTRGRKTLVSGVRASGNRVRGHRPPPRPVSGPLPFPLLLAIRLTGNLLHERHANAIGSQDPALHQLPYQPHQLQERGREVRRRRRACGPENRARPPPVPAGRTKAGCIILSPLRCASEPALSPCLPYLSATGVLQLQILLHEDLVDLVQDDVHAVATHQSQVSVTLRGRGS